MTTVFGQISIEGVGFEISRCLAGPLDRVYLDFDETITEGQSAALQVQAVIAGIAKV